MTTAYWTADNGMTLKRTRVNPSMRLYPGRPDGPPDTIPACGELFEALLVLSSLHD